MFIGLLVSAAVAAVVQVNPRLLDFAAQNFFLIAIGQIAIVFGISFGITQHQRDARARRCSSSTRRRWA